MTGNITRTVGCDLGDRYSHVYVLDATGQVVDRARLVTSQSGFSKWFRGLARCRVVLEVGTHSRWVHKLLSELGHEVIVANARQVQLISASSRKDDRVDAETLARLARGDVQLLRPIRHRSEEAQRHLGKRRGRKREQEGGEQGAHDRFLELGDEVEQHAIEGLEQQVQRLVDVQVIAFLAFAEIDQPVAEEFNGGAEGGAGDDVDDAGMGERVGRQPVIPGREAVAVLFLEAGAIVPVLGRAHRIRLQDKIADGVPD